MLRSNAFFLAAVLAAAGACSSGDDPDPDATNTAPGDKDAAGADGTIDPSGDGGDVPQATCAMDASVTPTFEEQRLVNRLPGKSVAFATELLAGTGFDVFEKTFADELCKNGLAGASTFDAAKTLVAGSGRRLWQAAVGRVQGTRPAGTLPAGDDRMLYWARLAMRTTLRAWNPSFALAAEQRVDLEWEFERASRGQDDVKLPASAGYVRILLSGFDPFTLGDPGTNDSVAIRIGNPSGASALAYDGLEFSLPNGKTAHIESFILPVSYGPFERGMQEDTLGPWFSPGASRADVVITMSQGSGFRFKLEEYNGRFHGEFVGNDGVATCKGATLLASTPGCSIQPPKKWIGYESLPWVKDKPPQFVDSTLPIAAMIGANTGAQVTPPPDTQATSGAFDVVWGYDFETFPDCAQAATQLFYNPVSTTYPPPGNPQPPSAASCARSGSGGDYLSNESAYRATLLRNALGLTIPVGHIHTPVMTRFATGNDSAITDAKFEAYRTAIVQQGRLLVEAVAKSL